MFAVTLVAGINNGSAFQVGGSISGNSTGGSGVVILKYSSGATLTIAAGLTSNTYTEGNYKVTAFKAGTGTVSIAS